MSSRRTNSARLLQVFVLVADILEMEYYAKQELSWLVACLEFHSRRITGYSSAVEAWSLLYSLLHKLFDMVKLHYSNKLPWTVQSSVSAEKLMIFIIELFHLRTWTDCKLEVHCVPMTYSLYTVCVITVSVFAVCVQQINSGLLFCIL